jgi:hypothetical protein
MTVSSSPSRITIRYSSPQKIYKFEGVLLARQVTTKVGKRPIIQSFQHPEDVILTLEKGICNAKDVWTIIELSHPKDDIAIITENGRYKLQVTKDLGNENFTKFIISGKVDPEKLKHCYLPNLAEVLIQYDDLLAKPSSPQEKNMMGKQPNHEEVRRTKEDLTKWREEQKIQKKARAQQAQQAKQEPKKERIPICKDFSKLELYLKSLVVFEIIPENFILPSPITIVEHA